MRRRIAASAVAVATLLTVLPVAAGTAMATTPSVVRADDVFYPDDQEPDAGPPAGDSPVDDATTASAATDDRGREAALMRGDRLAADLLGWMPSLYQGKWYDASIEKKRKCILDRESNFNYRATNGTYHGAYQMSAALARGATWMMQKEVRKEFGAEGVEILQALRKTTPNRWNRYWQDRAFWTIWRNGAGANHWGSVSNSC